MRGSSPLEAAACTVLFDVECFCDSISLSLVARAALELAYFPCFIGFGIAHIRRGSLPHRRVQRFQRKNCHQQRVAVGCAQGNHAARLALFDILQKSHELHHPPRLRNRWMTWHSERRLRRVRWSTRRLRRLFSWCGTCKRTNWRLRQNQWSLQPHQASPTRLCQLLQDMTYTFRKPVKPRIWAWTCPVQESQCVEPWPTDGPRR